MPVSLCELLRIEKTAHHARMRQTAAKGTHRERPRTIMLGILKNFSKVLGIQAAQAARSWAAKGAERETGQRERERDGHRERERETGTEREKRAQREG